MEQDEKQTHLKYEIEMMRQAWQTLSMRQATTERPGDWDDWAIRNALLESFLIHARVLIHFLYDKERGKDSADILAEDFCASSAPWVAGQMSDLLTTLVDRVSKEVAHLTIRRKDAPDEKAWDDALLREVEKALSEFLQHADRALLGKVEPLLAYCVSVATPLLGWIAD